MVRKEFRHCALREEAGDERNGPSARWDLGTVVESSHAREVLRAGKIRVYVQADTVFLQERVARAIGGEKDFEVAMHAASANETRRNTNEPTIGQKETLVKFSSGLVLEDLHRIHGWKIVMPGLKVLLLGAPQNETDFSKYVRGGINGFLPADSAARELVAAVRGLSNGNSVCSGAQCGIYSGILKRKWVHFRLAALHRDLGLTRRE